jgi:hypothetical protein
MPGIFTEVRRSRKFLAIGTYPCRTKLLLVFCGSNLWVSEQVFNTFSLLDRWFKITDSVHKQYLPIRGAHVGKPPQRSSETNRRLPYLLWTSRSPDCGK